MRDFAVFNVTIRPFYTTIFLKKSDSIRMFEFCDAFAEYTHRAWFYYTESHLFPYLIYVCLYLGHSKYQFFLAYPW